MAKKAKKQDFDPALFKGIAHRGLHNDEFTENGLGAFKNALDHGFAMELDIHLTIDGELLVCHDSELKRTTGKEGIIEHLTLEEIRANYRLLDGELVPTFQEVLDLVQEKLPIVVELKAYEGNHWALAKKALEVLSQIKDKKKITIISFEPRALLGCRKGPFTRGLLVCKEHAWVYGLRGFFEYLDMEDSLAAQAKYQASRRRGRIYNVWTIETEAALSKAILHSDMVTFQGLDPELIKKSL